MSQQSTPTPGFISALAKILVIGEIIAFLLTLAGALLKYLQSPGGAEFLMIGLSSLAGVYFLRAFMLPSAGVPGNNKRDFLDLLGLTILPKASGIASAVALIGILFTILHLNGAADQLMVGVFALFATVLLSLFYLISRPDSAGHLKSWLIRTVPIFLVGLYFFYYAGSATSA
jgi:hypothetical protein